jgi:secreted trypsin-like serine protease
VVLQRYGILFVLCSSFLFFGCDKPSSKNADLTQQPYDWNQGQGGESPVSECQSNRTSNRPVGIVGGEDVGATTWLAKGIVFLMQSYRDADGRELNSICTASLIDSNIVLTAAHCVDKIRTGDATLSVYFTSQPECESHNGSLQKRRHYVSAVRIHPNWDPEASRVSNRGDIALVRISGKAPSVYKPLKLAGSFVPVTESSPILIAGYGMVNPNYYGDFGGPIALRVAQAPGINSAEREILSSLSQTSFPEADSSHEFNNSATNEMLYIDQTKGKGICGGDSGGPSMMKNANGTDVVTGVASFVMNPEDPNLLCGYVAAHTSVFFHKDWIAQTFLALRNADSTVVSPFQ